MHSQLKAIRTPPGSGWHLRDGRLRQCDMGRPPGEEALLQYVEEAARPASLPTMKDCAVATQMPCHLPPKASSCVISRGCCLCFWFKSAGLPTANAGDVQEILQGCPCCAGVGVALTQVPFE